MRVGVVEDVNDGGSGIGLVVDDGGPPADYDKVGGIVRERGTQDFFAFGSGERDRFATDEFGDLIAVGLEKFGGGGRAAVGMQRGLDVDHEIVFVEPFGGGSNYRWPRVC